MKAVLEVEQQLLEKKRNGVQLSRPPCFSTGLAASNFVYGEIEFCEVYDLLQFVLKERAVISGGQVISTTQDLPERQSTSDHQRECFVDLGCGAGNCVAAAALCRIERDDQSAFQFYRVIGVDLLQTKISECKALIRNLQSTYPVVPLVEIVSENFLTIDWSFATVVHACATCFTDSLMLALSRKLLLLKPSALLIILDKDVKYYLGLLAESEPIDVNAFQMQYTTICRSSWGTTVARVYRKL